MKNKPEMITPDFMPSPAMYKWCEDMGIELSAVHKHVYDFIAYYEEKRTRRSNFNLAFRNWLKREYNLTGKSIAKIKGGAQSFKLYKPIGKITKNKTTGRESLKTLKNLL